MLRPERPNLSPVAERPSLRLAMPEREPLLYAGSGAGTAAAIDYLAGAPERALIRLTGGCMDLAPSQIARLNAALSGALASGVRSFSGVMLSGGTKSVAADLGNRARPSVPECAGRLVELCSHARHMGIIPGASFSESSLLVKPDGDWSVIVDVAQRHVLVSSERTSYLWDSEWQKALSLRSALAQRGAATNSVLLSFDGGVATEREVQAWAALSRSDPTVHVVLLSGGDPYRATDALSRRVSWLREHPQVHVCPTQAHALRQLLKRLDVIADERVGKLSVAS